MIVRIIMGIFMTLASVSAVTLAWPRITTESRPAPLQQLYDTIVTTETGAQAAAVLGVDNSVVETSPSGNLGTVAAGILQKAGATVVSRVEQGVATQAVTYLVEQFSKLSEPQKMQIRDAICVPQATPYEQ